MSVHLWVQISKPKVHSISGIWWCGQMINRFDIHFHLISEVKTHHHKDLASLVAQWWRIHLPMQEMHSISGSGRSPGEGNSIFAWKIPWTEETGGPLSVGLQRVWQDLATKQQQQHRDLWTDLIESGNRK